MQTQGEEAAARTELLDADRFAVTPILRATFAAAREEMLALDQSDFVDWFKNGSYEGTWVVHPLAFRPQDAETLGVELERNRARCPRTFAAIQSFGRAHIYGFSRLMPGCHILEHRDVRPPHLMRMHLPLVVAEGCLFRLGTEMIVWQPGVPLAVDALVEHEIANLGALPRTMLVVDFVMNAEEQAYVDAVRARNGTRLD